jgi:hypothetical protein
LVDLARSGVPKEDRLGGFLVDLAAPLYWRDYFDVYEIETALSEKIIVYAASFITCRHSRRIFRGIVPSADTR